MMTRPVSYNLQAKQSSNEVPLAHNVVKAATSAFAGVSLLFLSTLTMTGTVIGLTIATPLFVIFSPVLVPAVITISLLAMGFLASGGFSIVAVTVLSFIYRYVAAKRSPGGKGQDMEGGYGSSSKAVEISE